MKEGAIRRWRAVLLYGFLFGYVLSFVFEGQVYYQLKEHIEGKSSNQILNAMLFHMLGLIVAGWYVKDAKMTKKIMTRTMLGCVCIAPLIFIRSIIVDSIVMIVVPFLSGIAVACWGAFYQRDIQAKERTRAMADALIIANVLMGIAGIASTYISPVFGFVVALAYLIIAICLLTFSTQKNRSISEEQDEILYDKKLNDKSIQSMLLCFFLFIAGITINSGLMYGVFNTAYQPITELTTWYWAVPYIIALLVLRYFPSIKREVGLLYFSIGMMATGFICNMLLPITAGSYLVIDSLLLGAAGIMDLFWSKKVGETFEYTKNPVRILSIGWTANVFGVLIGGCFSQYILNENLSNKDVAIIALSVACISLIMLPTMMTKLELLLKRHQSIALYQGESKAQQWEIIEEAKGIGELTTREKEILQSILLGKANKIIALELSISENTVKTHVRNVLAKYKVKNRTELISYILQNRENHPLG